MKTQIRILLADDHPVVRKGIAACLARCEQLVVVGEAADGHEALVRCRELLPDLVLMDVDMPRISGMAVAEILHQELPQIKVLVLTMYSNPEYVLRIMQSGASGYVLKGAEPEELIKAIEVVHSGQTFFSPEVARLALTRYVHGVGGPNPCSLLTNREREVLVQIAEGLSNKEMAHRLGVGVRTIETHRERIMRKLGIHSVAGLTKFALAQGLTTLESEVKF